MQTGLRCGVMQEQADKNNDNDDLKVIVVPYEIVKIMGEQILIKYKKAFDLLKDK